MSLTTYNNISIPEFMYGTAWKKDATTHLVRQAVEVGFTAIDTANQLIHYDEAKVGDAFYMLKEKGYERGMFFLQTKFTSVDGQGGNTPYDATADLHTQVRQSMDSSLKHLNTDYVDSYVLHGPYSRGVLTASDWEVWSTMEELLKDGKTRMIGVSNVSSHQLDELCQKASTKPMVVQNRCFAAHGWDRAVREICQRENIIYQGFSLLTANPQAMGDPYVREIGARLGATSAQVIFCFAMQVGMLPLTGTSSEKHMKEDLAAMEMSLTAEEVEAIESIAG